MAKNHLFSNSLFRTLFQHNLVSTDGYVKANDEDLMRFSTFLKRQAKEKTSEIYRMRKSMLDEALKLIDDEDLTPEGEKRLKLLLHELGMELDEDGTIKLMEPNQKDVYLGPSEPNQSYWERRFVAESERHKTLKRDLKMLENWLTEISKPTARRVSTPKSRTASSQTDEKKYRQRTAKRIIGMEKGRRHLVDTYDVDNARRVQHALAPKESPGRVRKQPSPRPDKERPGDSEGDSFVTASDLSLGNEGDVSSEHEDDKEGRK